MKNKLKLLLLFALSIAIAAGMDSCKKDKEYKSTLWWIEDGTELSEESDGGEANQVKNDTDDNSLIPLAENVNIFKQVVLFPQEDVAKVVADTTAGQFAITYKDRVPDITTGNVVVVRDGNDVHIILVKNATTDGNTVNIEGSLGDYSYVFCDTKMVLASGFVPEGISDATTYTPYEAIPSKETSLSKKSSAEVSFNPLPSVHFTRDNITAEGGLKVKYKFGLDGDDNKDNNTSTSANITLSSSINLDITHYTLLDFKKKSTSYVDGVRYERSEDVDWDFEVYFNNCSWNNNINLKLTQKIDLVKKEHELIWNKPLGEFWFMIDIIPVRIPYGMDILYDFKVSASSSVELDVSGDITVSGQLGVYKTSDGEVHGYKNGFVCKPTFTPSISSNAELSMSASIYPVFYMSLYFKDLIGGGLAYKPLCLTAKAGYGVKKDSDGKEYGGIGITAIAGSKLEYGLYRQKIKEDDNSNSSSIVFKAPPVFWDVSYEDMAKFETFTDWSKYWEDQCYKWQNEIDLLDYAAWKTPARLFCSQMPKGTGTLELDYKKLSAQTSGTGNGGTSWGLEDDEEFYVPVKKGVPMKFHYKVLSQSLIDMPIIGLHKSNYFNTPSPYPVFFTSKYNKILNTHTGYDFDYEWTPQADDDYLEAFVYDYMGKEKGHLKMSSIVMTANLSATNVAQNSELTISGQIDKGPGQCEYAVVVDNKEIKNIKNVSEYSFSLPTGIAGVHKGYVCAKENGLVVIKKDFTYTVDKQSTTTLTLTCAPVASATVGTTANVTATANKQCNITMLVNGTAKTTASNKTSLTYDLSKLSPGTYKIKFKAESGTETVETEEFTCKVSKSQTPITNPLTISCPAVASATVGTTTNVTATASRSCTITMLVNGTTKTTASNKTSLTYDLSKLSPGTYRIKFKAQDGTETAETEEFECKVNEALVPLDIISYNTIGVATIGEVANVTATTNKSCDIYMIVDGSTYTYTEGQTSLTYDLSQLSEGTHTIKFKAVLGSETAETREFQCTVSKPTFNVHIYAYADTDNGFGRVTEVEKGVLIEFNAITDKSCVLDLYIDGTKCYSTNSLCPPNQYVRLYAVSNLSVGTHKIRLEASDSNGNAFDEIEIVVKKATSQNPDDNPDDNPDINPTTYTYVDLGLPSGTLWATCNVGAKNPWEIGETLDTKEDPATAKMGSDWRLPTQDEYYELLYHCDLEWTSNYNGSGVKGLIVKSKKYNTKHIFFPVSGNVSRFWTSTINTGTDGYFYFFQLYEGFSLNNAVSNAQARPSGWGLLGRAVRNH